MQAQVEYMESLERWQYPWIGLALLAFCLAIAGYYVSGIGVAAAYPAIVGSGLLIVVTRPKVYGYVMAGFGAVSIVLSGLLVVEESSPVVVVTVVIIGIITSIGGVRARRAPTDNR